MTTKQKIDVTKEYQTRDGRKVTQLVRFDAPNDLYPVHGVVEGEVGTWTLEGKPLSRV